ncbi:MAG: hypothetical protein WCS73_06990 [Lentisphaeria bacterium]
MSLFDMICAAQTADTTKGLPVSTKSNLPAYKQKIAVTSIDKLPTQERALAIEKLQFVKQVIRIKKLERVSVKKAVVLLNMRHNDAYPILRTYGKNKSNALKYNNYRNWSPAVLRGGSEDEILQNLANGYFRGDRLPDTAPQFYETLKGFWLTTNKPPMTVAYDYACKYFNKKYPGAKIPSFNQAKYQLKKIKPDVVCYYRDGATACVNRHGPYIERTWDAVAPGQCLIGDSRTLDTRIRWKDPKTGKYQAVRPTICVLMDARSWYYTSWCICPEAIDHDIIAKCLYMHCCRYGIPQNVYFDNGKDYCKNGFSMPYTTSDGTEHSVFKELGIKMTNSIPYNGRAKTVESSFHYMMMHFDKINADYLGSKPEDRPMSALYFDKHPEELPDLDQLGQKFISWCEDYHITKKNGKIHKGQSPQEIWDMRPAQQQLSKERITKAFAIPLNEYKVGRGPSVNYKGTRYYNSDMINGTKVLAKRDVMQDGFLYVCNLNGSFIGIAKPKDPINALADTEEERERIKEGIKDQRDFLKNIKTVGKSLTGGLHLVSISDALDAPENAKMVTVGKVGSVKGLAHRYTRHELIDPNVPKKLDNISASLTPPVEPVKEDRVSKKMLGLVNRTRHILAKEETICPATEIGVSYKDLLPEEDEY